MIFCARWMRWIVHVWMHVSLYECGACIEIPPYGHQGEQGRQTTFMYFFFVTRSGEALSVCERSDTLATGKAKPAYIMFTFLPCALGIHCGVRKVPVCSDIPFSLVLSAHCVHYSMCDWPCKQCWVGRGVLGNRIPGSSSNAWKAWRLGNEVESCHGANVGYLSRPCRIKGCVPKWMPS